MTWTYLPREKTQKNRTQRKSKYRTIKHYEDDINNTNQKNIMKMAVRTMKMAVRTVKLNTKNQKNRTTKNKRMRKRNDSYLSFGRWGLEAVIIWEWRW